MELHRSIRELDLEGGTFCGRTSTCRLKAVMHCCGVVQLYVSCVGHGRTPANV